MAIGVFLIYRSGDEMGGTLAGHRGNYWGFSNKFDLVHFRGSYLDVDLDDMRSENRLLDMIDWLRWGITIASTER